MPISLCAKPKTPVQMIRDEQSHSIPDDACDRARLSLNMGLADWPATAARIEAARRCVALQFEALVFGAPETQRRERRVDLGLAGVG